MSGVQIAADLRAAAEVLRRDGWCQHVSHIHDEETDTDQWCALGAVRKVVQGDKEWARYAAAWEALMDVLPKSPAVWNDHPSRTADEVIAAMEAAADAAERGAAS